MAPVPFYSALPSKVVVMYYQTVPTDVDALLQSGVPMASLVVYLSALHVGSDGRLYLNNAPADDAHAHAAVWRDMDALRAAGATVMVMLGGAGGAYRELFADFEPRYATLRTFLRQRPWIAGIDLDVEEPVGLAPICQLIQRLDADMPARFAITMAPVAMSLMGDGPGMGGFAFVDLAAHPEGRRIDWYNVQCYGCYDVGTFAAVLEYALRKNIAAADRIVFGMLGDEFAPDQLDGAIDALRTTVHAQPEVRGAALWEYGDTAVDPVAFAQKAATLLLSWQTCFWELWSTTKAVAGAFASQIFD